MNEQQFEDILRQALCPEVDPAATVLHGRRLRKGNCMNIKNVIKKACTAAAVILVLTTTVYATDSLNIKTLLSGLSSPVYKSVEQAEEKAGFEIDSRTDFSNGYSFESASVSQTKALDENDRVRLTYQEIHVELSNAAGEKLTLVACPVQERLPETELVPDQVKTIGEISVQYRVDHYKFVPETYTLTEADKTMMQQPGYYISYGADAVTETDVAHLSWEKKGIRYLLMDMDTSESADSLFSMAEDLILSSDQ